MDASAGSSSFSGTLAPRLKTQFGTSQKASPSSMNTASRGDQPAHRHSATGALERDVFFLVARYLSGSRLQKTFTTLCQELEEIQPKTPPNEADFLLPVRADWTGALHHQSYDELVRKNPHITPDYLPRIIEKLRDVASQADNGAAQGWLGAGTSLLGIRLGSSANESVMRRTAHTMMNTKQTVRQIRNLEIGTARLTIERPPRLFYRSFERIITTRGHFCAAYNALYDRTGSVVFTGGDDSMVKVWDAKTGWLMRTLRGHASFADTPGGSQQEHNVIYDMAISADNNLFASAASDQTVTVWDTIRWTPIAYLRIPKDITKIAFSSSPLSENQCLLVCAKDGTTRVYGWIAQEGAFNDEPIILRTHEKRNDRALTCAFNRTGTRFVVGGTDGLLYLYKIIPKSWELPSNAMQVENTGSVVPAEGEEAEPTFVCKLLRKLEASSLDKSEKPRRKKDIAIKEVKFSRTGDRFASGCMDGTVAIYWHDVRTQEWVPMKLTVTEPTENKSSNVQSSSAARQSHANAGLISLLSDESEPEGQSTAVLHVPTPMTIESVEGSDATSTGAAAPSLPQANGVPLALGIMPNGIQINGIVPSDETDEEAIGVTALCWSSNDARLVSAVGDCLLRVWDTSTGELLHTLAAHTDTVFVLDAHPSDPSVVLSASHDGKLILWDILQGKELKRFEYEEPLLDASFSPEGDMITTVDMAGQTHFFGTGQDQSEFTTFYDQFFPSDFVTVARQLNGSLQDLQTQTPAYMLPRDGLVDITQSPYPISFIDLDWKRNLSRSLSVDDLSIVSDKDIKLALLADEKASLILEQEEIWTKQMDNKRKRARAPAVLSDAEPDQEILDALNSQEPIVPLPESSGDEYAANEDTIDDSADDADYKDRDASEFMDSDFIDDDDDVGEGSSSHRKRKSPSKKRSPKKKGKQTRRATRRTSTGDSDDEDFRPTRKRKNVQSYKEQHESDSDSSFHFTDDEPVEEEPNKGKGKRRADVEVPTKVHKAKSAELQAEPVVLTEITTPSPWVSAVSQRRTPYLPQIGDFVAYVKKGHEQFVRDAANEGVELQYGVDPKRPEVLYGVVDKLSFEPGIPVTCVLTLHVHDDEQGCKGTVPSRDDLTPVAKGGRKDTFKIHFWDLSGTPDFLILYDDFEDGMAEDWEVGDKVQAEYDNGVWFDGTVVDVLEQESPWGKCLVRWDDDSTEPLSPWELRRPGKKDYGSAEFLQEKDLNECYDLINGWMHREDMDSFKSEVPYEQYPTYLTTTAYPMCLEKIMERLTREFYRRRESVAWDVDIMIKNALRFNQEGSELWQLAKFQLTRLRGFIQGDLKLGNERRWSVTIPKVKLSVKGIDEELDALGSSEESEVETCKTRKRGSKRKRDDEDNESDFELRASPRKLKAPKSAKRRRDDDDDGSDFELQPSPRKLKAPRSAKRV